MYAKWENSWWGAKVGWFQTFDLVRYCTASLFGHSFVRDVISDTDGAVCGFRGGGGDSVKARQTKEAINGTEEGNSRGVRFKSVKEDSV